MSINPVSSFGHVASLASHAFMSKPLALTVLALGAISSIPTAKADGNAYKTCFNACMNGCKAAGVICVPLCSLSCAFLLPL